MWKFLADVAGTLLPVEGISSENTGTKTKSYEWLTALLGAAPQVGETIADPVGRKCIVTVGQKNGYPRVEAVEAFTEPAAGAGRRPLPRWPRPAPGRASRRQRDRSLLP